MALKKIAENMTNDIPKIYLKRINSTSTTASSIENSSEGNQRFLIQFNFQFYKKYIINFLDIDASLIKNGVLNKSTETSSQQGMCFNSYF